MLTLPPLLYGVLRRKVRTLPPTQPCVCGEAQSKQRGVITSLHESDDYRQAQSKQNSRITSPPEPDNYLQVQSKQSSCTTSPRKPNNYRQAQYKKSGVITDPQSEGNGTKKVTEEESDTTATTMGWCALLATLTNLMQAAGGGQKIVVLLNILLALLGQGAMHNQNTAYFASQVQFNTIPNVMMPSKTWMDAITMFHHPTRVRVCVKDIQADDYHYIDPRGKPNLNPGQTERGPGHYAARHDPHHCRSDR